MLSETALKYYLDRSKYATDFERAVKIVCTPLPRRDSITRMEEQ